MRFVRLPLEFDAHPWKGPGDHPNDNCHLIFDTDAEGKTVGQPYMSEGDVVRRYNMPDVDGKCEECGWPMRVHGWIDGYANKDNTSWVVCPGDWIVTDLDGSYKVFSLNDLLYVAEPIERETKVVVEHPPEATEVG